MHPSDDSSRAGATSHCGLTVVVRGAQYEGFVALDSIVNGRSAGGVRITEDLAAEEVRELGREMTRKFSLFLLPRGGAKAGLAMPASLDAGERQAALEDFGRRIAPLIHAGIYYPGMDLNCGPDALRAIYRGAGMELGEPTDSSWFTALSIFHCLEACAARMVDAPDRPLRLAIEGFGSVARHLAERLPAERFRIAAVSTIEGAVLAAGEAFVPSELAQAKSAQGDAFVRSLRGQSIEREALLRADVDILLPSSRTWVIGQELARTLQARAVVPIANAPYAEGALRLLEARGVLCLPGYLSNVGGVLASSLYDLGLSIVEIEALFATRYRAVVDAILGGAAALGNSPTAVCERLVELHDRERDFRPPARGLLGKLEDRFLTPRLPRARRAARARRDFEARIEQILRELRALGGTP